MKKFHIFHDWGKWERRQAEYINYRFGVKEGKYLIEEQYRECRVCGYEKIKTLG